MRLRGEKVFLRYLNLNDIDALLEWENNPEVREVSDANQIYSRKDIEKFVDMHQDLYLQKQLRLMICTLEDEKSVGCIDLFQFDQKNASAGMGILIYKKEDRKHGYASESITLLVDYCRNKLNLNQLFCSVQKHNLASIRLFKNGGFEIIESKENLTEGEIKMQLPLK